MCRLVVLDCCHQRPYNRTLNRVILGLLKSRLSHDFDDMLETDPRGPVGLWVSVHLLPKLGLITTRLNNIKKATGFRPDVLVLSCFLIGCDLLTPTNPVDCSRAQVGWRILWKVARWWVSWRLVINVATGGWWNWCWQTVEAFQVACWWVVGFYIQT